MKIIKLFVLITLTSILSNGCIPDDGPGPDRLPTTILIEGWAVATYENDNIPYVLSNESGDKVSIIDTDLDNQMDGVLLELDEMSSLVNFEETTGLPSRLTTSDGNIAIFHYKENLTKLDIAYVLKDQTIAYSRDIEINSEIHQLAVSNLNQSAKGSNATDGFEAFLNGVQIATFSVNAAFCFSSIIAAGTTFAALLPAAWISCSSAAFSLYSAYANAQQTNVEQQLTDNVSAASYFFNALICSTGDVTSCIDWVGETSHRLWDILNQIQLDNSDFIEIGEGALISGYGEVKVTLTWNTTSDIDLWVNEPNGNKIYFDSPVSNSGGVLDFDDVDGFGPENIFWKENAPVGNYSVQVHYYGDNGAGITNYSVQMEVQGSVQVLQGTLVAEDQLNDVATFAIGTTGKSSTFTKLENRTTKVLHTRKANRTSTLKSSE